VDGRVALHGCVALHGRVAHRLNGRTNRAPNNSLRVAGGNELRADFPCVPALSAQQPPRTTRAAPSCALVQFQISPRNDVDPAFPAIGATAWNPPDPCLAVGPSHILATVNMKVAWYGKSGAVQFESFLGSSGNLGFFEEIDGGDLSQVLSDWGPCGP
jgi:hypothetical protein